jgi:uncharacterized membrane protein
MSPTGPAQFNIVEILKRAWDVLVNNLGIVLGATIVYMVIMCVGGMISYGLVNLVLAGPMTLGLVNLMMQLVRGKQPDFGVLFSGFQRFLPAFLAYLVITIFVLVGTACCIIPGLIVGFLYMLTFFFMSDQELDFWPAMEASRIAVSANIGQWLLCALTCLGLSIVGTLACCIGTVVTIPISILFLAIAYDQAFGIERPAA